MPADPAKTVVLCGALTVFIAMGIRQTFGLFLQPVTLDLGIGREQFALAVALCNLAFGIPLFGMAADRYGARRVVAGCSLLLVAGLALLALFPSPTSLFVGLGLVAGLALGGVSYVVVLGAVGRVVAAEHRGARFGAITAAGSFGMFAFIPLAQWALAALGWQHALLCFASALSAVTLASLGFPSGTAGASATPDAARAAEWRQALRAARRHSGYWLLNAGFFVCGFHVAFIATHLPAFLADEGLSPSTAALSLALIGLFNIVGSYLFGRLGDRYRKKYLLSFLYAARAAVIGLFLLVPLSETTALVFGGAVGFLWLATVPLTSGTVAQIFGARFLSTLYGVVFLSHQVGSFLGVWIGGRVYDATGSYDAVWQVTVILGLAAAALHLPIADKELQPESAVS